MGNHNKLAVATATSHGVLPLDVVFDILARLPAEEICRLRAVCRPWRSLTSDPPFIKAHAARHPGPLIVYYHERQWCPRRTRGRELVHVNIMDLSGDVIKQVPVPSRHNLLCSRLDLICVGDCDDSRSCYLIDPPTGATSRLLVDCFPEGRSRFDPAIPAFSVLALGRVDCTGEYKMLMVSCMSYDVDKPDEGGQRCHVLTVNGAGGTRWRPTTSPEFLIKMATMDSGVVVGGAVYYFAADSYVDKFQIEDLESDSGRHLIASFDFETERWSTVPVPRLVDDDNGNHDNVDEDTKLHEYIGMLAKSSLAELKGYLVLAHNNCRYYSSSLDLWFLTNIENGLWVKEYSIQNPGPVIPVGEKFVKPLLLGDDGRIVFFLWSEGTLVMYDPMTKVFSVMEMGVTEVALYTGSLLAECLSIKNMVAGAKMGLLAECLSQGGADGPL